MRQDGNGSLMASLPAAKQNTSVHTEANACFGELPSSHLSNDSWRSIADSLDLSGRMRESWSPWSSRIFRKPASSLRRSRIRKNRPKPTHVDRDRVQALRADLVAPPARGRASPGALPARRTTARRALRIQIVCPRRVSERRRIRASREPMAGHAVVRGADAGVNAAGETVASHQPANSGLPGRLGFDKGRIANVETRGQPVGGSC